MKIEINVDENLKESIVQKIREEITEEIIYEKMLEYLKSDNLDIIYIIKNCMNLYEKYIKALNSIKTSNKPSMEDRMIVALYSLINDRA